MLVTDALVSPAPSGLALGPRPVGPSPLGAARVHLQPVRNGRLTCETSMGLLVTVSRPNTEGTWG